MRRKGVDGALIGIGGDGSTRRVKAGAAARKGMSGSASCTLTYPTIVAAWMFLVLLFFVAGASAGDYKLPDTGQHKCYDDAGNEIACPSPGERFYGQDAQYQGAEPAFRDNGDGTVSDLNTGLMWQQGDEQNHCDRDGDGREDGGCYTWQEAIDYCRALDLAGHTDWRLPTRWELMSIVNYGRYHPAIDTRYFPDVPIFSDCWWPYYWSSSSNADYSYYACDVGFGYGGVYWYYKGNPNDVRCVRAGS